MFWGALCFIFWGVFGVFQGYLKKVEDIGTDSVCQVQAIGTEGRLCLDQYPVRVPHNEVTECVCPENSVWLGWVGFAWTGSVCALF